MNSSSPDPWKNLVSRAKAHPASPESDSAPYGFATRVVARWKAERQVSPATYWWEVLGVRALALSLTVMVVGLLLLNRLPSSIETASEWHDEVPVVDVFEEDLI